VAVRILTVPGFNVPPGLAAHKRGTTRAIRPLDPLAGGNPYRKV